MGIYKNDEYLKREITQSRHQFIYGYNTTQRSEFLKSLEKEHPIEVDSDKPAFLYSDSLGIPAIDIDDRRRGDDRIDSLSNNYLLFSIAAKILESSMGFGTEFLDERLSKLIDLMNDERNSKRHKIKSSIDLLREIKMSRDFYYNNCISYAKGLIDNIPIADLSIPFLFPEMFVRDYKEAMGINSYFGIIFDKKSRLLVSSTRAINWLIGSRNNSDISIKVATEPDDWETYIDVNGNFIQETHDYGIVELDNSHQKYIKSLIPRDIE